MEHAVPDTPRLLSPPSRPHPPRTSRFPADRSTSVPTRTQYWTDFRRVTWKDSFAHPAIGTATHAARSVFGNPSRRSRAIVWGSVPSFFSMMQVSQTVWRLLTQGPLSRMWKGPGAGLMILRACIGARADRLYLPLSASQAPPPIRHRPLTISIGRIRVPDNQA